MRPPVVVKLPELLQNHVHRSPIGLHTIPLERETGRRGEVSLGEHPPCIQFVCQHLQDHTGQRIAFDHFPEMRRSAAILIVVSMMKRPDAESRRVQNLTSQDIESEANDHIQIPGADGFQRVGRKSMDETLGDRDNAQRVNAREQIGTVFR